ncbi:MAG: fluoride efflux transporter CrcB [Candidatus Eisenbacteria bacterium]|nr:fluoride efflux transporter CrcB [Candidatus Eisenbacteria bacterium]
MKTALLVALGGALGSVLRWLVSTLAQRATPGAAMPWGTLLVNVAGSCAIGALLALADERGALSPEARFFLVTGVLGGFTTFSAYSAETLALMRAGHGGIALFYASASVVLGVGAAYAGWLAVSRA